MRISPRRSMVLLMLAAFAPALAAQGDSTARVDAAFKALDEKARLVAETYLRTDCELGEEGRALAALLPLARQVQPYLQAVVAEGPPSPVRADLDKALEESWRARLQFLASPEAGELGPRALEMMKAITREQYLKDQRAALQAKYRERAALALTAIEKGATTSKP